MARDWRRERPPPGAYVMREDGTIRPARSMAEHLETYSDKGNARRVIKQTRVDGILVSTVFLGLDHNFGGGQPICFEGMIFGGPHDQYQERYYTIEQARLAHPELVAKALDKKDMPAIRAALFIPADETANKDQDET